MDDVVIIDASKIDEETIKQKKRYILEQIRKLDKVLYVARLPSLIIAKVDALINPALIHYKKLCEIKKGDKDTIKKVLSEVIWRAANEVKTKNYNPSDIEELKGSAVTFLWLATRNILKMPLEKQPVFYTEKDLYNYLSSAVVNIWKNEIKKGWLPSDQEWIDKFIIKLYAENEARKMNWSPEKRYFQEVYPREARAERVTKKLLQYLEELRQEEQEKIILYILSTANKTAVWGTKRELDKSRMRIRRELGQKRYTSLLNLMEEAKNLVETSISAHQSLTKWLAERLRRG